MPHFLYRLLLAVLVLFIVFLNNPVYGKSIKIKLGHINDREWPISKGITEFAKLVETQSNGLCSVKIYPAKQLGAAKELFDMVKIGNIDLALIPASVLASEVKEIGTLGMPFIFRTYQDVDKFIDGNAGVSMLRLFNKIDLIGLAFYEFGMFGLASSVRTVTKIEDFDGLSIMVNSPKIVFSSINLLGAKSIKIPKEETYFALQKGLANSVLTTELFYDLLGYKEVAPYFSQTNHFYSSQILLMNKQKFSQIPNNLQKIIRNTAFESSIFQRKLAREEQNKLTSKLIDQGVNIAVSPDIIKMQDAMKPIYSDNKKLWEKLIDCSKCPFPPWCCD